MLKKILLSLFPGMAGMAAPPLTLPIGMAAPPLTLPTNHDNIDRAAGILLCHYCGLVVMFVCMTICSICLAYSTYIRADRLISIFSIILSLFYLVLDFCPRVANHRFAFGLWCLGIGFLVGFGCQEEATLYERLWFMGFSTCSSLVFLSSWTWGHRRVYSRFVRLFGPFTLMSLGYLGHRDYLFRHIWVHFLLASIRLVFPNE